MLPNDPLTRELLCAALGKSAPQSVIFSEVTPSTNDEAKRAFADGLNTPALFAAAEQTVGRGRMGRRFLSPAGSGVYFSLFVPLTEPPRSVLYATCAAGVAVRRGILAATGCDTRIKWVNDLRFRDRKVCGILAEAPVMGDRYGRKYVILFSILGAAPFTLAMPYTGLGWTIFMAVMSGLVIASAFSAIVVYATDLMPDKVGMVAGIFFGLMFGLGGIGSAFFGWLADATSIDYIFKVSTWLPLMGVIAFFLPDVRPGRAA